MDSDFADDMISEEFWGCTLTKDKPSFEFDPNNEKITIRAACLGEKAKPGERNLVSVATETDNGAKINSCLLSLKLGQCDYVQCLHEFTNKATLSLKLGSGPISLTGMRSFCADESDEEDDSEDEEDAPQLIEEPSKPIQASEKNVKKAAKRASEDDTVATQDKKAKIGAPIEEEEKKATEEKKTAEEKEETKKDEDEGSSEEGSDEEVSDEEEAESVILKEAEEASEDEDSEEEDAGDIEMDDGEEDSDDSEDISDEDALEGEDEGDDESDDESEEEEAAPPPVKAKTKTAGKAKTPSQATPVVNGKISKPQKEEKSKPTPAKKDNNNNKGGKSEPKTPADKTPAKGNQKGNKQKVDVKTPAQKTPAQKTPGQGGPKKDITEIKAILAKSPNLPKKMDKFKNFLKNNYKVTEEKEISELWSHVESKRK